MCKTCLSDWYFEKDGRLYCKEDYWARYGESCNGCSQIITGPIMVSSHLEKIRKNGRYLSPGVISDHWVKLSIPCKT